MSLECNVTMLRALQLAGLLLTCALAFPAAAQTLAPDPVARHRGGNPRPPRQPIGPPLSNPASPAARLYRASPEERDRALEKLPPRLQQQLRTQLQRFDAMPKPQQEIMIRRAERYAALTQEQQAAIRRQLVALRDLPQERRTAVNRALRRLGSMSDEQRLKVVAGDDFKARFSPEEQQIIADLSEVMLPPL
jgi:hypothetical protein